MESYYKKVVLKGNSKAVKKINKAIQKDCETFLKGSDSLVSYAKMDKKTKKYADTYVNTAVSKVSYNNKGIISIVVSTEKITLDKVCADKTSKVASTLKKKILKEAANLDVRNVTKNKVKDMSFYLKPGKKAVVCFGPYELGWGGWVRTYTIKSKYQ